MVQIAVQFPTAKIQSQWWYWCIGAALLGYLANVFSFLPFLQHELIGQAFWWTQEGEKFLNLIFDSERMDCFPGRFRYVEWLTQAAYWRAMSQGWLPRDLYDLVAIALSIGSACLLAGICRRKGLRPFETFLIVSFFLLSTHVFMIAVFNFRKAKVYASFFFLLMLYLSARKVQTRTLKLSYMAIGIIGFITDPYFILLSPLVALAADISQGEKRLVHTRALSIGLILGAMLVIFLNNIVGPHFSSSSQLFFTSIPGKPKVFISFSNIPYFYNLIPDIVFPNLFDRQMALLGWALIALFVGLTSLMIWRRWQQFGWVLLFVASLPIGAFFILPVRDNAYFSGYYGHTFLVLFTVSLVEVLLFLRHRTKPVFLTLAYVFILFVAVCHQIAKPITLDKWQRVYSASDGARKKVFQDYAQILEINKHLVSNRKDPYVLVLDSWKLDKLYLSKGQYFDNDGALEHTDVGYLLIPAMFRKEFDAGRLRIQLNKPKSDIKTAKK
jgi:hypothetical protein